MIMLKFIVILCFLSCAFAQVEKPNGCPEIIPQVELDPSKLLGNWYEFARIDDVYEQGHDCSHIRYFEDENGNIVEEANSTIRISGANYLWRGTIEVPENSKNGLFYLVYNEYSTHGRVRAGLLAANWDQYIIVVACCDLAGMDDEFAWVITKNPTLEPEYLTEVEDILQSANIPLDKFTKVSHENCPAY